MEFFQFLHDVLCYFDPISIFQNINKQSELLPASSRVHFTGGSQSGEANIERLIDIVRGWYVIPLFTDDKMNVQAGKMI